MPIKPSIPKGTRDFNPKQVAQRQYIINTIRSVFELYGFEPIETPAMENMETLTGKYGAEGDKLLFKILNSGDYLSGADESILQDPSKLTAHIAEKGLRYDLTVPLARYVVMHRHEITFPFKRYQIQPVWRADRPQKGRYREFWQCDADVTGSASAVSDAELIKLLIEVFRSLSIPQVDIRINHREVLHGVAELWGAKDRFGEFMVMLDKLDKVPIQQVDEEFIAKGFRGSEGLLYGHASWSAANYLSNLEDKFALAKVFEKHDSISGQRGMAELTNLLLLLGYDWPGTELHPQVVFFPSLARGLDYYTGPIFEVVSHAVKIGSIASGGRYDNLTGSFGLEGIPGTGISFGLERINDVMEELGLFEKSEQNTTKILVTWFDQKGFDAGWKLLAQLRANGIISEIYPDAAKRDKQIKYARVKEFSHVITIGDRELESGKFAMEDLKTGEQRILASEQIQVLQHLQH